MRTNVCSIDRSENLAERVWRMRAHDIKEMAARVFLAAQTVTESKDKSTRETGEHISRICSRIVDTCESHQSAGSKSGRTKLKSVVQDAYNLAKSTAGPNTRVFCHVTNDLELGDFSSSIFRITSNLINSSVELLNRCDGGVVMITSSFVKGRSWITIQDSGINQALKSKFCDKSQGLSISSMLAREIGAKLERKQFGPDGTVYLLMLPKEQDQSRLQFS
ncbi:MAG: hypothetical protein AAGF53_07885 [Pseudomonadota bacterium]